MCVHMGVPVRQCVQGLVCMCESVRECVCVTLG